LRRGSGNCVGERGEEEENTREKGEVDVGSNKEQRISCESATATGDFCARNSSTLAYLLMDIEILCYARRLQAGRLLALRRRC
jgi:hypothetical protein